MAPVKLYYFDGRGIGEPIRHILSYGGIEFEDNRTHITGIPTPIPDEIKKNSRWSKLPYVVMEDGKTLMESLAITRYFAGKTNLIPDGEYEAALCDEYVDASRDMLFTLFPTVLDPESPEKQKKMSEAVAIVKSKYLSVFDSIVKNNDEKHLVTNKLTWADIYLAYVLDHLQILSGIDFTVGYNNLQTLKATVHNTPKIKAWLDNRPNTKY